MFNCWYMLTILLQELTPLTSVRSLRCCDASEQSTIGTRDARVDNSWNVIYTTKNTPHSCALQWKNNNYTTQKRQPPSFTCCSLQNNTDGWLGCRLNSSVSNKYTASQNSRPPNFPTTSSNTNSLANIALQPSLNNSSHLKRVATLPRQTLMSEK